MTSGCHRNDKHPSSHGCIFKFSPQPFLLGKVLARNVGCHADDGISPTEREVSAILYRQVLRYVAIKFPFDSCATILYRDQKVADLFNRGIMRVTRVEESFRSTVPSGVKVTIYFDRLDDL